HREPGERRASWRALGVARRAPRGRIASQGRSPEVPKPPAARAHQKRAIAYAVAGVIAIVSVGLGGIWIAHRTPTTAAPSPATQQKSYLAVLRFKDLTGDPNGQAVVDGFAETLATRLAQFSTVQVMRPQKPDALADATPQQAARELGANVVVTGSMMRNGDRLRVTYAVADIRTNSSKSDLIEGSVNDLFAVQEDRKSVV